MDVEIAGTVIPAGSLSMLGIASANRDPEKYDDPDRWDLHRRPTDHLAFSFGEHFCLGTHLARAEMAVALDTLLTTFPDLALVDEPVWCGSSIRGPRSVELSLH